MGYVEDLRGKKQAEGRPRYRARYRDPSGRERAKSFVRKADAERFLRQIEADKLQGQWVDPRQGRTTVKELAERWYATTVGLKATTRKDYRSLLDTHVIPAFGDQAVAAVDTLTVRGWLATMLDAGLSSSRATHAYHVLAAVLEAAVQAGVIARNPATGVRRPRIRRREMQFLSAAEVEQLAEAIRPPYGTLVRFAAYTGLRAGEIVALRVRRVDLLRGTVRVSESTSDVRGHLIPGPTKSYGERTVRLPRFLCAELTAYLAERPAGPDAFVFTTRSGEQLRHNNFYRRDFKPALDKAGLSEKVRFHDLRHTCASLLIAQGAHPKAIQLHLGHSSIQITMDRYGHLLPDELGHLADRLDAARSAIEDKPGATTSPDGTALRQLGRLASG